MATFLPLVSVLRLTNRMARLKKRAGISDKETLYSFIHVKRIRRINNLSLLYQIQKLLNQNKTFRGGGVIGLKYKSFVNSAKFVIFILLSGGVALTATRTMFKIF